MSKRLTHADYVAWLENDGRGIVAVGEYINNGTKMTHRCKEGHEWDVKPREIKRGHGCPSCAKTGFDKSKPAILYIAEHELDDGRVRVNVGITNRSFEERYSASDLTTVARADFWHGDGDSIYAMEQLLHKVLDDCLDTTGLLLENKKGTKECFDIDYDTVVSLMTEEAA